MVPRMVLRGLAVIWTVVLMLAHAAPARADAAEVEALISKGNELRRAGTPGPALPYFQKAYELARTPRTTGQLGLAELAAGYPVEAADHLATALESPNDPSIVKYRQMLADALTMARAQIGELAVDGGPPGAEVVVNGKAAGALPLSAPIKLPARTAEVVVRAPGYAEQRQLVPIVGGQHHALAVKLARIEQPAAATPTVVMAPSPPSPPQTQPEPPAATVVETRGDTAPPSTGSRTAAWIFGAGAVVAAGTGLALNLAARSNLSDFNGSCKNDPIDGIVAHVDAPLALQQCQDRYDALSWQKRWSVVGYVSSAALAITSAVLFLTSAPPTPTTHAHLRCAPTPNGVGCAGIF
jgi:hypothetical protein